MRALDRMFTKGNKLPGTMMMKALVNTRHCTTVRNSDDQANHLGWAQFAFY